MHLQTTRETLSLVCDKMAHGKFVLDGRTFNCSDQRLTKMEFVDLKGSMAEDVVES